MLGNFKSVVMAVGLCVLAAPAVAKKDYGQAPPGCTYGPRGGLHCNTAKFQRQTVEEKKLEDRRLRRECKGRPRAGACAGYN